MEYDIYIYIYVWVCACVYIYIQIQEKVPRKILEKFFIIKICTQCKTSHTLKFDLLELPDNKNFGNLFSKHEVLFPDQSNFPAYFQFLLSLPHLFNQFRLHEETNEQSSLVMTDTALISLLFF